MFFKCLEYRSEFLFWHGLVVSSSVNKLKRAWTFSPLHLAVKDRILQGLSLSCGPTGGQTYVQYWAQSSGRNCLLTVGLHLSWVGKDRCRCRCDEDVLPPHFQEESKPSLQNSLWGRSGTFQRDYISPLPGMTGASGMKMSFDMFQTVHIPKPACKNTCVFVLCLMRGVWWV